MKLDFEKPITKIEQKIEELKRKKRWVLKK